MKGQADIIFLIIQGFVVTLAILVIYVAWNALSTSAAWQTSVVNATPQGKLITHNVNSALNLLGNAIAWIWIISGIASIIATFFTESSPVFAVIGIILLPIEGFLGLFFHDYFFIISQNTFIAPIVNMLPQLVNFYVLFPITCMAIAIASIIFTFVKPS